MPDILKSSKHCSRNGNTILEAVAAIREEVSYAEITNTPLCKLSIDFKEAFDNISHTYLYELDA